VPAVLALLTLLAAVWLAVAGPAPVAGLRNAVFDQFQRWQPRSYVAQPVRIVDLDDESLRRHGQWPWPRTQVARMVERLREAGAAVVAFDMVFAEPDRSAPAELTKLWGDRPALRQLAAEIPDPDGIFAATLAAQPDTVTGFVLTSAGAGGTAPPISKATFALAGGDIRDLVPRYGRAVVNLPAIAKAAAGNGFFSFPPDPDGVVRRIPLLMRHGDALYPALSLEALRVAQGAPPTLQTFAEGGDPENPAAPAQALLGLRAGQFDIPTDRNGYVRLYYTPFTPLRYVPAWQVLEGTAPAEKLEGHVVFIGTSAEGLKDLRFNTLGETVPGVEMHAQFAEQVLGEHYLTRPYEAVGFEAIGLLAGGLVLIFVTLRLGAAVSAAIGLALLAAAGGGAWWAFVEHRVLFDPILPSIALLAIFLICAVGRYIQTERDQAFIRRAFQSYVSPNLVRHLLDNPDQLSLGGERRECSFVLTDLAGFTGLVERSAPDQVVALLNDYLDGMLNIAFSHDGTLDRIVGDAVAIMFSAPVVQPDHAARAVRCALEMDAFSEAFIAEKARSGLSLGRTRIGVNSGPVIVGNVGGGTIFDYRALGDAVNTAARLETVNKHLGTRVCVAGATAAQVPGFVGRPVGTLVLKGKVEGIPAFEPLSPEQAARPEAEAYRRAFALMEARDPAAREAFAALAPADPLAAFHLARLEAGEQGAVVVFDRK